MQSITEFKVIFEAQIFNFKLIITYEILYIKYTIKVISEFQKLLLLLSIILANKKTY